jgi:hypothetical protein
MLPMARHKPGMSLSKPMSDKTIDSSGVLSDCPIPTLATDLPTPAYRLPVYRRRVEFGRRECELISKANLPKSAHQRYENGPRGRTSGAIFIS